MTACAVTTALAGCAGAPGAAAPSAVTPTPAPAVCPSAGVTTAPAWPAGIPDTVPRIPTAVLGPVSRMQSITYIRFTTSQSLRDGVIYIIKALPSAGFVVGRGDAEATEADAPFSSPTLLGSLRLTILDACSTGWFLAVRPITPGIPAVTGPLIPYTPGPRASPLPFG